jgi:hypothetical protein
LLLVPLLDRLVPAFLSLLLGLLVVLLLLLMVLLLLLVVLLLVLFVLLLVPVVVRPADGRNAGQGERTDGQHGPLESLRLHTCSFSDAPRESRTSHVVVTRGGRRPGGRSLVGP